MLVMSLDDEMKILKASNSVSFIYDILIEEV